MIDKLNVFLIEEGDESTDFHHKEIPNVESRNTCLAIISLDFVLKKRWKLLSVSQKSVNILRKT